MIYEITVPGRPLAKARPRAFVTKAGTVGHYPEARADAFETVVANAAAAVVPKVLEGPVQVDIVAIMPRPKRLMRKADKPGFIWAPTRPDADNIRKAVLDGLQRTVLRDDATVVKGGTAKVYHEKGGLPRTLIVIRELSPEEEVRP